ncbi:MAG: T9SS type A sorting domain-containing protein [Bacteroidota bacterium]
MENRLLIILLSVCFSAHSKPGNNSGPVKRDFISSSVHQTVSNRHADNLNHTVRSNDGTIQLLGESLNPANPAPNSIFTSTDRRNPNPSVNRLRQVMDSVYNWPWNAGANQWDLQPNGRNLNLQYDSRYNLLSYDYQTWSGIEWSNHYRYSFTYDANDNIETESGKNWNGSAWIDDYRYFYVFDSGNKLVSETYQTWDGTIWVNDARYVYAYDSNNNLLSRTYKSWDGTAWTNSSRRNCTYDALNNLLSATYQNWYGSSWINASNYLYSYAANGNCLDEVIQVWGSSAWADDSRNFFTYDSNNNRVSETSQYWDGTSWSDSYRFVYTYDANDNMLSETYQSLIGAVWTDGYRTVYTYDANNNVLTETNQDWVSTYWANSYSSSKSYDANDYLTSTVQQFYDLSGFIVVSGDSTNYYFNTVTGTNTAFGEIKNTVVYPNPASENLSVDIKLSKATDVMLQLKDIIGKNIIEPILLKNVSGIQTRSIPTSQLPNGVYFLEVIADGLRTTEKVIVEHR